MGKKRKDYHQPVIDEITEWASQRKANVLQFSLGRSMVNPTLKGIPDLEIMTGVKVVWVEIKPFYDSGRLARLSTGQIEWFQSNQHLFDGTTCSGYAILTDKLQWRKAWDWLTKKNWNAPSVWVKENQHRRQLGL